MIAETMEKIRQAESQARQIIADGEAQADAMIEQARQDALQIKEESAKAAKSQAGEVNSEAEETAGKILEEAQKKAQADAEQLKAQAEDRKEAAVNAVLKHLTE
jgi:V/A-type H+/Na+-transporting ATPase subunit G/H